MQSMNGNSTREMLALPVALSDREWAAEGVCRETGQGWSRMALAATWRLLELV